jgi:hypothetical protein
MRCGPNTQKIARTSCETTNERFEYSAARISARMALSSSSFDIHEPESRSVFGILAKTSPDGHDANPVTLHEDAEPAKRIRRAPNRESIGRERYETRSAARADPS